MWSFESENQLGKCVFIINMKEVQKNPIGKQGRKEDDAEPVESKDAFNAFFKLPSLLDSFEKWQ